MHTKVSLNVRHRVVSPARIAVVEGPPTLGGISGRSAERSIITMHSAKGLEWPIVVPINSVLPQLSVGGQPLTGLRARV